MRVASGSYEREQATAKSRGAVAARAWCESARIMAPNERPVNEPTGPSVSAVYFTGEKPESVKTSGSE